MDKVLASICGIIVLIILVFMSQKNSKRDPLLLKLKIDVSKIDPKYMNLDLYESDESYTQNKEKIFLCLRDENGEYYSYNMILYVLLHELAHFESKSLDPEHISPEFHNNFDKLLEQASKVRIYDPTIPLTPSYCGINIHKK